MQTESLVLRGKRNLKSIKKPHYFHLACLALLEHRASHPHFLIFTCVLKLPLTAVMVRFGESCSTLSEPLVFQPHEEYLARAEQSPPLTPRKTVLSLKPLHDGSTDWGFTGTFEMTQVKNHPGLTSFNQIFLLNWMP